MSASASAIDITPQLVAAAELSLQRRKLAQYLTAPPGEPFSMSPPQREYFNDRSPKRFLRAANKVGKTFHLAAETWAILLGVHPHIHIPTPCRGLYLVPDLDHSYADDVCRALHELEPPGVLADGCTFSDVKGYSSGGRRGLTLANGSQLLFRSSHQKAHSLAGVYADFGVINEPPARHLWGEVMRAFSLDATTPIMCALTVVDDARKEESELGWLREIITAPDSGWYEHVAILSEPNCPHRTPESIKEQIANCPEWERPQRIYAEWDAPAIDRIFVGFDDRPYADGGCVVSDADLAELAPEVVQIGLGFDHAERPGGEIAILGCWWQDKGRTTGVVLDTYVSSGRTTPAVDAQRVLEVLRARGLSPLAIDLAKGDHNSAGKSSLTNINRELELAFAAALDSSVPPFSIEKARKGQGSVMYGVRVLNNALANNRLFVHERAKPLIHSLNNWRGKEMHKDAIDAARYLFTELLDPTRGGAAEIRLG